MSFDMIVLQWYNHKQSTRHGDFTAGLTYCLSKNYETEMPTKD